MSEHEEIVLNNLRTLFEQAISHHDDGIGQFMTPSDLQKLCKQFDIGPSESDIIFANLDRNSDGLLSVEEFLVGFRTLNNNHKNNHKNQNNCSTSNNVNNVSNANSDQNYSSTFDHTNHDDEDEKDEEEKNISNSEDNLLDKITTTNQLVGQISLISFDEDEKDEEAQENVDNESKCKCDCEIATQVMPTNALNKSSSIIDEVQQSCSNNNNQSEQRNQQLIGSGIKSVAVRRSNSLVPSLHLGRRTLSSEHDINNQQNYILPSVFEMNKKAKPGELLNVTANDPEEQNEQKHVEQEDSVDSSQDSGFDLLTGIEDFEVGPLSQLQQPNKGQMRKLLLDLVQNIQLLQSENKKLVKIWSSREENFPELEQRTKNMETKTDNLHNYIQELVEINHEMFHDPIKSTTSTSTSTSNQTQKNYKNLKFEDQNQLHESNDSLRETIRKLQNNLHSVLAEQNRLRDEYSDRVKHLEGELRAKQRRNSRTEDELEFLKKTSQSLEHSRRVMEIRKLFDSYLESSKSSLYDTNSQNVEQRAKNIWEHKREMWFKKRDSFQSDSNLQNILDRGLTTNLKGRKLSSRSNCWQPKDEKIMEETPSSWRDGIQKLEAIKSSSNESLNDSDDNRVIQRNNSSVRRRVSFSNPEVLEQNLEKIKKSFRSKNIESSFEENENNQESEVPLPSPKNVRMSVNIFKIIFIGDSMVGKTSFIHRATRGFFTDRCSSTIGIDFKRRLIKIKDTMHELQLWDTAGQERFRSITMNYFRKVDAICLMYDVTRERTFTNVRFWVNSIQDSVSTGNLPILILGNKIDCRNETTDGKSVKSCVSTQDGEKMATNLQMGPFCRFMETSGKSGHNVEEALAELTKMMIWTSLIGKDAKQMEREEREKAIKLQENAKMQNKSKSKCCKS